MVSVDISDPGLRGSFAAFLRYKLEATVTESEGVLQIKFTGAVLAPPAQARLLERLLWAWHTERDVRVKTSALLTATADQGHPEPNVTRHWHSTTKN